MNVFKVVWRWNHAWQKCRDRLWVKCCLILCVLSVPMRCLAQSSDNPPPWQAMRVYVPEEQVDSVVPRDYLTIDIDDLERLLAEESRRRAQSTGQAAGVQRAVYVARWSDQFLTSQTSMLQATFPGSAHPLNIGRMSVAIDDPLFAPTGSQFLARHLRYVDDTRLQLLGSGSEQSVWFGFKAKTRRGEGGQQSLDLTLPRAALATLLIAVPANAVVTADLPCARTDDPKKFLPDDWPAASLANGSAEEHWFVIHLSGREMCSLNFTPAPKPNLFSFRTSVASAQCDLIVQPAGLQATCRYQLAKAPESGTIHLRVEEPLHVRTISINGVETSRWRTIEDVLPHIQAERPQGSFATTSEVPSRVVEVELDESNDGPVLLAVDALAGLRLPFEGELPRIEVADAFVMDGRGSLTSAENVQIEDVHSDHQNLSTTSAAGYASWQWQWTGEAPAVHTRLRSNTNQWSVRSLTRFNVQTNVIVATAHVQLSSGDVRGNQVAFKLASGWFVDSVELESASSGITAKVRQTNSGAAELSVRWEEPRTGVDVRLTINAHFPQRTEVDSLRLQSTRIVELPSADQVDTYVIESSGRFQMEIDPELLRLRINEDELLAWQRDLLPRLADVWIFRGTRYPIPPIRLRRTRSTLDAKLHTIVTQTEKEVTVAYRVVCQPISGSIGQLRLMLPIPPREVAPTWSLATPPDGNYPRGLLVNSRATSSSTGETNFQIELSQDISEPFQLVAEIRLPRSDGQQEIPLPSMPQAVTQDAIVVVPAAYTISDATVGIEVLPRGMCCTNGALVEAPTMKAAEVTAARYDPNVVSHLAIVQSTERNRGTWIRQAVHEHWRHNGGRYVHRTAWNIVLPTSQVIRVKLPDRWQLDSVAVDGLAVSLLGQTAQHSINLSLPQGDSVRVDLQCSSQDAESWWGLKDLEEPESGLAARDVRRVLWFPGTIFASAGWPSSHARHATWTERLLPSAWWQWISVDPWQRLVADQTFDSVESAQADTHPVLAMLSASPPLKGNWWSLELGPNAARKQVWHAERSLLSCALLAVTLVVATAVVSLCRLHVSRWFALSTATLMALCIVPASLLMPVQLLALGVSTAILVRLSFVVMARSRPVSKGRDANTSSLAPARPISTAVLALIAAASFTSAASGQPLAADETQVREEIFGILIPVDSDLKMAGDYVYVPTRLSRLLSNVNQQDVKNSSVTVQAAFYSLRISTDPDSLTSSVGEITAELTIQPTQADAELRLQFAGRELQLQRAFLDSQEIFQGQRLKHDGDVLTWRSSDADSHTLRLVFRPKSIVEKDGRGVLSVGIPAIPTAKVEVMGDDLRDVTVDAIGGTRLESPRFLTAQLGPASRLLLTWPLVINRSSALQVQSDTWVHSRGEQIMAQCQLRVRGATALPSVLHVVGDSNWQPVGQDWEDCRLISAEGASATGRPVYSVQRLTDSPIDTLTVRVLMLTRSESSPQTLSIPFLSLQEATPQQRSLALSHIESPIWKPVGIESWQPLLPSQATAMWDKARLSEQPTLLRVPNGTVIANLQRTPPPPEPSVDETTEISLQSPEIKTKYAARWSQPISGVSAIRFHVPSSMRVEAAFVDALPARHTAHRAESSVSNASSDSPARSKTSSADAAGANIVSGRSKTSEVIVFVDGTRGGVQSVSLQLSSPARMNKVLRIPRPVLLDWKIGSSVVQIFRGAELSSELRIVDDADLQLARAEIRPSPLLLNLHSLIGQVELGDRFRDSPELPIEVRLSRSSPNRKAQAVVQLQRSEQGWTAQLNVVVAVPEGEVNHVFFDVPSGLAASFREPIDANVPIMLWPSADTNREIICALPQLDSDGRSHIAVKIRLPSGGPSQSVTVPDIRLVGLSVQRPVVALPEVLSGEEVRWSQVGRQLPDNWLMTQGLQHLDLEGYRLHEPSVSQFQAMWHSRQQEKQTARVLLTRFTLDNNASTGNVCYWIDPRNQPYLTVGLAQGCEVIGATLGEHPIAWTEIEPGNLRFLLRPSYLPLQLKLFLRWSEADKTDIAAGVHSFKLPTLDAKDTGECLVGLPRAAQELAPTANVGATALTVLAQQQLVAQAWVATLVQAAPIADDRQIEELTGWLPAWSPSSLALADIELTVPKQYLTSEGTSNGSSPTGILKTNEFWRSFLQDVHQGEVMLAANELEQVITAPQLQWYRLDGGGPPRELRLEAVPQPSSHRVVLQALAAVTVLFLSVLLWNVHRSWLKARMISLAEYVWPLWVGLALIAWLFLPVAWPSSVITLCALIVLWRRYRELRRDRQFVLSPRVIR